MRILHTCEFYYPHIVGAEEVVRRISEGLVQRGHEVTVATTRDQFRDFSELRGVAVDEFSIRGNAVKGFRGEVGRFLDYVLQADFDIIMNYAAQCWPTPAPHRRQALP